MTFEITEAGTERVKRKDVKDNVRRILKTGDRHAAVLYTIIVMTADDDDRLAITESAFDEFLNNDVNAMLVAMFLSNCEAGL